MIRCKLEPGGHKARCYISRSHQRSFGTGNIASVALPEISSVYRFTTRQTLLMWCSSMLKVLIPKDLSLSILSSSEASESAGISHIWCLSCYPI